MTYSAIDYLNIKAKEKFISEGKDAKCKNRNKFAKKLACRFGFTSPQEMIKEIGFKDFHKLMKKYKAPSIA